MSRKDLFNAVQRKYLKTENSLSPVGESEQTAPKFNRIQSKYLDGIDALPADTAGDGALAVPALLSFRTGPQTGEKSRTDLRFPRSPIQKEGGFRGEHGSRPEIAPASAGIQTSAEVCAIGGSLASLGMTGESLPEPDTLVFRAPK